jgi:hypothetical protein
VKKVADDTSLARLFGLLKAHNSNLDDLLHVQTESEFIAATEVAIERAMKKIENGSKEYSTLSEPGLSHLLADFLDLMGWRATAETNNNGHVDVVDRETPSSGTGDTLGECKMHDGYQHHVDGCAQLLGYCTGRERRAFCMDFIDSAGGLQEDEAAPQGHGQEATSQAEGCGGRSRQSSGAFRHGARPRQPGRWWRSCTSGARCRSREGWTWWCRRSCGRSGDSAPRCWPRTLASGGREHREIAHAAAPDSAGLPRPLS